MGISNRVKMQVEALKKPDDDSGYKNDGKCALQEIFGFFPQKKSHTLCTRQSVVWKFHYEGDSFAGENGIFQQKCHEDSYKDAQEV